jgi:hypothetical protein
MAANKTKTGLSFHKHSSISMIKSNGVFSLSLNLLPIGPTALEAWEATDAHLLETEELENLVELLLVLAHGGELDVDAGAEAGSEVGWAGQDVSEMLVPHVGVSTLLHQGLDLGKTVAETLEDGLEEKPLF